MNRRSEQSFLRFAKKVLYILEFLCFGLRWQDIRFRLDVFDDEGGGEFQRKAMLRKLLRISITEEAILRGWFFLVT